MRIDLENKVFVVTGAAQGIGKAIVSALLQSGARVAALDLDPIGLQDLPQEVLSLCADLGDRTAAAAAMEQVAKQFGQIDGLVTAAGGVRSQVGGAAENVTSEDWRKIFEANVDGAMWCAQAALPYLKAQGSGRIITIASGAGLRPSLTGIQAYTAAKHALVGLTKQLALELGPSGITVNAIAPGFILSNPSTIKQWEAFGPEKQQAVVAAIHRRRLGTPQDIAHAVVFFASEQADWISGQILSVDGGHA